MIFLPESLFSMIRALSRNFTYMEFMRKMGTLLEGNTLNVIHVIAPLFKFAFLTITSSTPSTTTSTLLDL